MGPSFLGCIVFQMKRSSERNHRLCFLPQKRAASSWMQPTHRGLMTEICHPGPPEMPLLESEKGAGAGGKTDTQTATSPPERQVVLRGRRPILVRAPGCYQAHSSEDGPCSGSVCVCMPHAREGDRRPRTAHAPTPWEQGQQAARGLQDVSFPQ